jgi:glucose-1-phosphate thymidylyltransferase
VIGVVPAAGNARRLQPLDGSKEVLIVSGRPVMDHVVERMRIAGCDDVVVVTRPEKDDVRERAEALGARVVLARPADVSASVIAALHATGGGDIVLLGFPDTIWFPIDGYVRLIEALEEPYAVALGLFESAEPERSDVVAVRPTGEVVRVVVKPPRSGSRLIWGCAAASMPALDGLSSVPEPGRHWDWLASRGRVVGVELPGPFVDIGTPEALEGARGVPA